MAKSELQKFSDKVDTAVKTVKKGRDRLQELAVEAAAQAQNGNADFATRLVERMAEVPAFQRQMGTYLNDMLPIRWKKKDGKFVMENGWQNADWESVFTSMDQTPFWQYGKDAEGYNGQTYNPVNELKAVYRTLVRKAYNAQKHDNQGLDKIMSNQAVDIAKLLHQQGKDAPKIKDKDTDGNEVHLTATKNGVQVEQNESA